MAQAVQFESKLKRDKLKGEVEDMEKLAKRVGNLFQPVNISNANGQSSLESNITASAD